MKEEITISIAIIGILLVLNLTIFRDHLPYTIITSVSILIISALMVSKVLKK